MVTRPTAKDVVCVGESMALVTPRGGTSLEDAREFRIVSAGAESNVAMNLASLGHRVAWISRLGNDPLGRRVAKDISQIGVDVTDVEFVSGAPTGVFFKDPSPEKTAVYYYRKNSAATTMDASILGMIAKHRPRLVHVTGVTPALSSQCSELVDAVLSEMRVVGVTVCFDVNYREPLWPPEVAAIRLLELAQLADCVFVGLDEAMRLWKSSSPQAVRELIAHPTTLVVKDGGVGATVFFDTEELFVPALRVNSIDPVGAGDAFAAGWISGFLRELPPYQRIRLGHLLAASAMNTRSDFQPVTSTDVSVNVLSMSDGEWGRLTFDSLERAQQHHSNSVSLETGES